MSAKGRGVRAARLQAIKSHIAACGHFRVSTDRQGKSGLGLEAQRKSVLDFAAGLSASLSSPAVFSPQLPGPVAAVPQSQKS